MITSDELLGLARQMDRAALAIDLGSPALCPPILLRLLEQELVLLAAQASIDELDGWRAAI